jgi:pimeloyl-ACP methyl ester carboxylesterase
MQRWYQGKYTVEEFHERLKAVPNCQVQKLADCGHMLHHDQPQALAALIEGFLGH